MSSFATPRPHLVERAAALLEGLPAPPAPPRAAGPAQPLRPAAPPPFVAPPPPAPPAPPPVALDTMLAAGLVARPGTQRSRFSEEIALLHQQIARTLRATEPAPERAARLVLLTSARPGEGKSFCALNIAAAMAAAGTPVLLVDADGKQGSIGARLGIGAAPGLWALALDAQRAPAALAHDSAIERLSILPYGPPPEPGAAAPSGPMLAAAALRIAAALPGHVVILDTSPCLSTSDPSALAPVAGQVVMVVEAERTQRNEVEAALDMVEACPTIQLLLNRTRLTANDTFGAYGDYDARAGG